ncbi:MAG: polysaccharide pyruvyl transferase family protein, partial [Planctomycetia bacterium]|nr:polysaccharide pyruvyl transferase family protein [Planctomycetia bacterium]
MTRFFDKEQLSRRNFLTTGSLALAALACDFPQPGGGHRFLRKKNAKLVLRSSWQMVNIGDIGHTAGVMAIIQNYLPQVQVTLWASSDYSPEVAAMEKARFPGLQVVQGYIDSQGRPTNDALGTALDECDFILHGSGPSVVAKRDIATASERTGKPFGFYGITYRDGDEETRKLLSKASFVFFRDSVSLARAKADGITAPTMEFAPDGAFAFDIYNDDKAAAFLKANNLEKGKFVCVIPRYRVTPYWSIHKRAMKPGKETDDWNKSQKLVEHDHKPILQTVLQILEKTEMKVLVCPEDMSQMELGKKMIYDKIPEKFRNRVVWRKDFWLPDEAVSIYMQSAGLFGLEMHSPIMCIGNGVPAIVCRFEEQTSKGYMWKDIGLGDWLFDFDNESDIEKVAPTVLNMITDQAASHARVDAAQKIIMR